MHKTCSIEGCGRKLLAKGLCGTHYQRVRYGIPMERPVRGYGTGRAPWIDRSGYRYVWDPEHPNANQQGYIFEHRKVASGRLGRPLYDNETVHHRNGDRLDNRPENLELRACRSHGQGQSVEDLLIWAREIIVRYG